MIIFISTSSDPLLFPGKAPEEILKKFPPTVVLEVFLFFVGIFSRFSFLFCLGENGFPSAPWIPSLEMLCIAPFSKTNSLKVEFDFYITEATRFARWVKFFLHNIKTSMTIMIKTVTITNTDTLATLSRRLRAAGRLLELIVIPGLGHGQAMEPKYKHHPPDSTG